MEQKWPQEIWLVRHGQSAGNVARDAAEAAAGLRVEIAERDVDVPLSELGQRQSRARASWCDVILRLRSVLDTLTREYCRERVLIVGHQVIVNCFRYLLERMDEARILEEDRAGDVPNCSVTSYAFDPKLGKRGKLALRLVNFVAPLEATGTPVTIGKDVPTAAKA